MSPSRCFQDPTGTTANPIANNSGVVPGFVFSPFDYPAASPANGTLYATNLSPQGSAFTSATGSASLRLNEDKTPGDFAFPIRTGLGSPRTAYHVHSEVFGTQPQPDHLRHR